VKEQTSALEPKRPRDVTLNDLLDKLLEKGLMLYTDLVITVAGIPLIGLNLRLALAGMSTMLRYGMMSDWDEVQRARVAQEKKDEQKTDKEKPAALKQEAAKNILDNVIWCLVSDHEKGSWEAGKLSLRGGRLCWFRLRGGEPLFVVDSPDVRKVALLKEKNGPEGMPVLKMDYLGRLHPQEAYFSGAREALQNWLTLLGEAKGTFLETCPACGVPAPARRLLNEGCAACGWVSIQVKRRQDLARK